MRNNLSIFRYFFIIVIALSGCGESEIPQPIAAVDAINSDLLESDRLKQDAFFLSRNAYSLIYDNEMAELAFVRAHGDSLKLLAKKIKEDNDMLLEEIRAVAQQNNITLPEKLGADTRETIEELREIRPNIFNHEYLEWAANRIDTVLDDLSMVSTQTNNSSSILDIAHIISLNKQSHRKSIDKLHQKIGYHYD